MNVHVSSPEAWLDTRHTQRRTLYRPVVLEADGKATLCLLRDLSAAGLRAKAYKDFARDEPVCVHFNTDLTVSGAVAWSHEGQIGVEFDKLIDVPEILSLFADGTQTKKVKRSPRLPIDCSGTLTVNDRTALVQVEDISQRGVKVRTSYLQTGDEVHLLLDGLERRKATVRWVETEVAGLNFIRPLAFDELALWTAQQRVTSRFGCRRSASIGGGR